MLNICLNCSKEIENVEEYCNQCEEKLNEVIDARGKNRSFEYQRTDFVNVNSDPFYQNRKISGILIDGDDALIAQQIRHDPGSSSGFWLTIGVMILIMAISVIITGLR